MPAHEQATILIVDDSQLNLIAFQAVLADLADVVLTASSGDEAISLVADQELALIILDVKRPGLDGFAAAKLIHEQPHLSRVPMLFVTASLPDEATLRRGYEHGAVDYLPKPVIDVVLRSKVSLFVDLFRKERVARARERELEEARAAVLRLSAIVEASSEAAERLKESEERFRVLAESATDAILIIDQTSRILFANRAAEKIFGYLVVELIGQSLVLLTPERFREHHLAAVDRFVRTRERSFSWDKVEMPGRRKDGSEVALEISFGMFISRGAPIFSGIVRDISERKRAQETERRIADELARSNRDLEQFAYISSHDLQEPLRTVAVYAQIFARKHRDQVDDDSKSYLGFIVDGVQRMKDLIEALLTYSRIGKSSVAPSAVDANAAATHAIGSLAAAVGDCGAEISRDELPRVLANQVELVQVFQNFIGNAIKYRGAERPRIHIGAELRDAAALFSVRAGIGFDAQDAGRIFEIFQRLHSREEYPGNGVGLGICKKIIERFGGKVWAESTPGQGATFYFTLPRAH